MSSFFKGVSSLLDQADSFASNKITEKSKRKEDASPRSKSNVSQSGTESAIVVNPSNENTSNENISIPDDSTARDTSQVNGDNENNENNNENEESNNENIRDDSSVTNNNNKDERQIDQSSNNDDDSETTNENSTKKKYGQMNVKENVNANANDNDNDNDNGKEKNEKRFDNENENENDTRNDATIFEQSYQERENNFSNMKSERYNNNSNNNNNNNNDEYLTIQRENEGLKQLWNEERNNCKRAYELLKQQKEKYNKLLSAKENSHSQEYEMLEKELKNAMKMKDEMIDSLKNDIKRLNNIIKNKEDSMTSYNDKQNKYEKEMNLLKQENERLIIEHSETVSNIRKNFEKERQFWEKEKNLLNQTKNTFVNDELSKTQWETEKMQYTQAMARYQQSLEEKQMELSRMKNTLRFTKEDHLNISNQLKNKTESLNLLETQFESMKQENEIKLNEYKQRVTELTNENFKLNEQIDNYKIKLEMKMENENDNSENTDNTSNVTNGKTSKRGRIISIDMTENETKISELANRLLEKQNMLDEMVSKNRQLSLELKEYKLNTTNLRNQIATLQQSIHNSNGNDIEKGITHGIGVRGMMLKQRKLGTATSSNTLNYGLSILDNLGIQLGFMLRGRPWMRLLIVFYIIILHLFVFVVLYSHHNQIHDDIGAQGPPLANSIVDRP